MENRIINSISVFCGSGTPQNQTIINDCKLLGKLLANKGIELVYGGSNLGLMEVLARTVLENGGVVTGVIPDYFVSREIAYEGLTKLYTVGSLHERKQKMVEISDAFIALPGGYGTMDELFEILTMAQLGQHNKPVGVVNIEGFYDGLITLMENMCNHNLLKTDNYKLLICASSSAELLNLMEMSGKNSNFAHIGCNGNTK